MLLINTNTNTYPYQEWQLRKDYPEYNVYQPLPNGICKVVIEPNPEGFEETHEYTTTLPVLINDVWTIQWELKELPPKTPTQPNGPGPWDWDEESQTWYLYSPLSKATHD